MIELLKQRAEKQNVELRKGSLNPVKAGGDCRRWQYHELVSLFCRTKLNPTRQVPPLLLCDKVAATSFEIEKLLNVLSFTVINKPPSYRVNMAQVISNSGHDDMIVSPTIDLNPWPFSCEVLESAVLYYTHSSTCASKIS